MKVVGQHVDEVMGIAIEYGEGKLIPTTLNINSIYLYNDISPEYKLCSEPLVTTLSWLYKC